mmetsp:Transcript_8943/g.13759  ORF Transcript_8943/g.13759 Transcript_8943/m.13759 type:complete len:330 (+) Transcript_8943:73-1062(+)
MAEELSSSKPENNSQDSSQAKEWYDYASLRILCLHGDKSNAKKTHRTLQSLDRRLFENHGVELVYINSPLKIEEESPDDSERRIWWEESEKHPFGGLDASLLQIQQIWKSSNFSGILAFGQGAAIASLLPLLQPIVEFGIFLHGEALLEDDEMLMENWPSLHMVQESAKTNPSWQRLVKQFPGQIHVSATETLTKIELNIIGKFIVHQKKRMRASGSDNTLVLQNKLLMAEQQASSLIAEHIADNPPKALMALIQPQEVAGWNGARRREFGAEGGGAPCPSEFLLKRDKRHSESGQSRHHPSHSKSPTKEKSDPIAKIIEGEGDLKNSK